MFKKTIIASALSFTVIAAFGQIEVIDSVIRQNRYTLRLENGKLSGTGADFLVKASQDCQFVALGEEHNRLDIPPFTTGLFRLLQQHSKFEYLAIEQDPLGGRMVSQLPRKGITEASFSQVKKYPHSYTFATDQEVQMMADVTAESKGKGLPVWGCDQAFGVSHYLERLLPLAPSAAAREFTKALFDSAMFYEHDRDIDKHYILDVLREAEVARLKELYASADKEEVNWLIHSIELSNRVYNNYNRGARGVPGSAYLNGYEREEYMKERFMEEYNYALKKDKKLPRAVLKFGHWHVMNGRGPSRLETTGVFARALAKSNGLQSLYISTLNFRHPDSLATMQGTIYPLIAKHLTTDEWVLIDLRPLRGYAGYIASKKIITDPAAFQRVIDFLYAADCVIYFGTGKVATYDWKKKS